MPTIKRYGSIVSLYGETAHICIKHADGCSEEHEGCPFKKSLMDTGKKDFIITTNNKINAEEEQFVEISVSDKKLSIYAFIIFIFPLIMIFLGALGGYFISNILPAYNVLFPIIGGILGFICSLYVIRIIDKKSKNSYEVTKIVS